MRTWLAERGVPDAEADVFMGHKAEGSATGKRYIHRRPEYLRSATEGIESLYAALAVLVKRPFKGRELDDQPQPDFAGKGSALADYCCLQRRQGLDLGRILSGTGELPLDRANVSGARGHELL